MAGLRVTCALLGRPQCGAELAGERLADAGDVPGHPERDDARRLGDSGSLVGQVLGRDLSDLGHRVGEDRIRDPVDDGGRVEEVAVDRRRVTARVLNRLAEPGESGELDAHPLGLVYERMECEQLVGTPERLRVPQRLAGIVQDGRRHAELASLGQRLGIRRKIAVGSRDRLPLGGVGADREREDDEHRLNDAACKDGSAADEGL